MLRLSSSVAIAALFVSSTYAAPSPAWKRDSKTTKLLTDYYEMSHYWGLCPFLATIVVVCPLTTTPRPTLSVPGQSRETLRCRGCRPPRWLPD